MKIKISEKFVLKNECSYIEFGFVTVKKIKEKAEEIEDL
jgi:hypothetical protein